MAQNYVQAPQRAVPRGHCPAPGPSAKGADGSAWVGTAAERGVGVIQDLPEGVRSMHKRFTGISLGSTFAGTKTNKALALPIGRGQL